MNVDANSSSAQTILRQADASATRAKDLLAYLEGAGGGLESAVQAELDRVVDEQLGALSLDAIKEVSDGRLRIGAIEKAGYRTVGAVKAAGNARIAGLSGVGGATTLRVFAAVSSIEASLRKAARVRFDAEKRPVQQLAILDVLQSYDIAHREIAPMVGQLNSVAAVCRSERVAAALETQRVRRFFAGRKRKQAASEALERLAAFHSDPATQAVLADMGAAEDEVARPRSEAEVWKQFEERSVFYNGLLIDLCNISSDNEEASEGFLPAEIVDRIREFELDSELLNVSLRGYQAFGAKYSLVQKHAILGDEMGLGKTIEALAVVAHLSAQGATHFLVVCPTSVMTNWEREIQLHTRLKVVRRLHGSDRHAQVARWARHGGIGVTTFGTLSAIEAPGIEPAALIVDEAHYVKNPDALRTKAVKRWASRSKHVLLMSGTPMENRVGEFRTLVEHVRPDIAATLENSDGLGGADAFRKLVAPVYLRRNQQDVLDELPPRIEVADWLTLEGAAERSYAAAVAEGNYMAMRRAAFLTDRPKDSPKLERLREIVEDAAERDRRVVVFSFFRDVISRVCGALGDAALEPITGSVGSVHRQRIIDEFSRRSGPSVLVAQIEAGGVGLNIQAASVVVLAEPQWKPSIEEQAIARCHRMGQTRRVEVHRLLTENSVDEHIVRILALKSALFAQYARRSEMTEAAVEAVDVTDVRRIAELANTVDQERAIVEMEQQRMGLAVAQSSSSGR